ncbi:MAG: penicillin acylase family protein [Ichthyobacteriaceae bacterium]|nr:penicillin acylase family protein [Ichthyobacteriaceae bacterium]
MKSLKIVLYSVITIIVVVALSAYFYTKSASTNYKFNINSEEVSAKVEIIFDDMAVPHIYAENEKDAMFALGYVHASERLWQMDLIRHVGEGNLSELFGEKLIKNDKFFRTIGIKQTAIKSAEEFKKNAPENIKKATYAYIAGINKFIEEDKMPVEYKLTGGKPAKFKLTDLYLTTGYMAYSFAKALKTDPLTNWLSNNLSQEYLSDLSITSRNNTTIPVTEWDDINISKSVTDIDAQLPIAQFIGSNAWVISGDKTKSGKVVFANDAHIGFASPSVWYEAHIHTPELDYYGNHLAGFPFPLIGHTKTHSWGLTMFANDDIDLYREKIENNKYLVDSTWHDLTIKKELIKVKDGNDLEIEIKSTNHGPIISDVFDDLDSESNIAMWWTFNQYPKNLLIESAYGLSRSKNITDVKNSAEKIHSPGLNIMYGDADGNIAWLASAKLPIRPKHVNSKTIIDGTKSSNDIEGWYPFSKNPHSINPKSGFVYSANNAPDKVDGIYHPGYYSDGNTRALSIIKALSSDKKDWTIYDAQQLQLNGNSPVSNSNNKLMVDMIKSNKYENIYADAYKIMDLWKGTNEKNELAPTIYYKWMFNVSKMIFEDEIGKDRFNLFMSSLVWERSFPFVLKNKKSPWWNNVKTDEKETANQIMDLAFTKAINDLQKQLGNDITKWNYGKVHTLTFNHAMGKVAPLDKLFNIGPFEVPAGKDALNKYSFKLDSTGIYNVTSGPSMRITIDFADVKNSESIIPTGQSGNVFSKYYSNQAEMFVQGKYRKQRMDKDDIIKNSISTSKINPIK